MVSFHNVPVFSCLIIKRIYSIFRFKRGTAMLTSSIGGPRKAYTNRCTNSSPRYSVRTTMLSSFVCLGNFLGFRLNDKHNASKNSNMFWREFCSIRCKNMKNN